MLASAGALCRCTPLGARPQRITSAAPKSPGTRFPKRSCPPAPHSVPVQQEFIPEQDMLKLEYMLDCFKLYDADGNGKIDRRELRTLLESVDTGVSSQHFKEWLPDKELDRVMRTYDKDMNGVIDYDEFESMVYDGLLLDSKLKEYEEAFHAVDTSGRGAIDVNQLEQLFRNLGQEMSQEKVMEVMRKYDTDKSGQIEFNEFLQMFRDEMLDLKEVMDYMATHSANGHAAPVQRHEAPTLEGDIRVIHSEQELEELMACHDKRVVLFSTVTWCRASKRIQRAVQKLAQYYGNNFVFVKLYANSNEVTKRLFRDTLKVRITPSFMIFDGTQLLHSHTGADKGKLETALRSCVPDGKAPAARLFFPQAV